MRNGLRQVYPAVKAGLSRLIEMTGIAELTIHSSIIIHQFSPSPSRSVSGDSAKLSVLIGAADENFALRNEIQVIANYTFFALLYFSARQACYILVIPLLDPC